MAVYFFDSSAIVKHYVLEKGTTWVNSIVDPSTGNEIYLARITGVEVIAAVTRRERNGATTTTDAISARTKFQNDFINEYQLLDTTASLLFQAMSLAEKHALRGYDAVQLAAALEINRRCLLVGISLIFVSADKELNKAAFLESLTVDDPNNY